MPSASPNARTDQLTRSCIISKPCLGLSSGQVAVVTVCASRGPAHQRFATWPSIGGEGGLRPAQLLPGLA